MSDRPERHQDAGEMIREQPQSVDYLRGKVDALATQVEELHADLIAHMSLCTGRFGVLIAAIVAAVGVASFFLTHGR